MDKDWAIIVGINQYPLLAGVATLEGAVRDAKQFHQWVLDPKGGNVPRKNVTRLISPAKPVTGKAPRPIFAQIHKYFSNALAASPQGLVGRRLYIYLSGHGISPASQNSTTNAGLLMADARSPNWWHNFTGNIWADGMRGAATFREVVLIMDCCRDIKNNAPIYSHMFGDPTDDGKDCYLFEAYSTSWGSKSREIPLPPGNQKRGVFTHSLLEVLKSGRMTGLVLKESVKKHLASVLQDEKKAQEPEIKADKPREYLDKIIFNEQAAPAATPVTISGHDARLPIIEEWPAESDYPLQILLNDWTYDGSIWKGTLHPGLYSIRHNDTMKRFRIYAAIPHNEGL
jgi:hypothetical protein